MRVFSSLIMAFIFCFIILTVCVKGNTPPENIEITGIPSDGRIENPLNASVTFTDPDGDEVTTTWLLDGEEIGSGNSIQRYVYPGRHNLTVVLDDGNGSVVQVSRTLDPIPPPGWNDEPDNRRNELIFWSIFGAGGMIFGAVAAWIWLSKGPSDDQNREKKSS